MILAAGDLLPVAVEKRPIGRSPVLTPQNILLADLLTQKLEVSGPYPRRLSGQSCCDILRPAPLTLGIKLATAARPA